VLGDPGDHGDHGDPEPVEKCEIYRDINVSCCFMLFHDVS
jgi:hypothetical protein